MFQEREGRCVKKNWLLHKYNSGVGLVSTQAEAKQVLLNFFLVPDTSKLVYASTLAKTHYPHFSRTGIHGHVPFPLSHFSGTKGTMSWVNFPITCSLTHSRNLLSLPSQTPIMFFRRVWLKSLLRFCRMSQLWFTCIVEFHRWFITIASGGSIVIVENLDIRMCLLSEMS